ncbi:DUF1289 domain-containing protein [Catenovulum sp. SM1970]|uniref:DUF1289 domain-containing protein n=1 Tax=Marinifaba aquimaris TaxID=2741323 RepID=UPI0015748A21|nr:DUF1289 domain-containing protein [Marinifaba aquimaris]NTS77436.1 DUF1289 domain-containing protein [Marinifaba aquimaris]
MKSTVNNPCRAVCSLNEDGICTGCGRTQQERNDWIFSSDTEQQAIVERSKIRLKVIKDAAQQSGPSESA